MRAIAIAFSAGMPEGERSPKFALRERQIPPRAPHARHALPGRLWVRCLSLNVPQLGAERVDRGATHEFEHTGESMKTQTLSIWRSWFAFSCEAELVIEPRRTAS